MKNNVKKIGNKREERRVDDKSGSRQKKIKNRQNEA